MRKYLLSIAFLTIFFSTTFAQELTNLRVKSFPAQQDTLFLDSLSIVPNTVRLLDKAADTIITTDHYEIDHAEGYFIWKAIPAIDTVEVVYRVFPLLFSDPYFHKDTSLITPIPRIVSDPFIYNPDEVQQQGIVDFGGLDHNGSFSRGISFGNNQDVVLNSSFNLQLSGDLGNEIEISAAMTDNNIPIQPEGNTQQIQDFDQVYIQLKRRQTMLAVGDIELLRPKGYFMNFYKKLQGGKFSTVTEIFPGTETGFSGSVAVSKGQYARNNINGQEGNQGPYRLRGNNNESFLIVLAGTERVYIDGVPMVRGSENDYVIDYNAGEITFTPNRLITKDSRILVEFEYSVEYYFRSLVYANNEWKGENWDLRFNIYSEQDSKNQPILDSLDLRQKQLLSSVGDSIQQALYPGYVPVESADSNFILYTISDTVAGGVFYDSIFVFTVNRNVPLYRVNFSYVGPGNGNYRIAQSSINGRIYEWVAPIGGVPQGSYVPLVLLVTPKKRQLMTIGGDYKLSERSTMTAEVGISNNDVNTFSQEDDADDKGVATFLGWDHYFRLNPGREQPLTLRAQVNYEFTAQNFQPIEVYRPVEFTRDWNLQEASAAVDEHLANVQLSLNNINWGIAGYNFSTFVRPDVYQGLRHSVFSNISHKGFTFKTTSSILNTDAPVGQTLFLRPKAELSKSFAALKHWRLGMGGEMERNEVTPSGADTLSPSSFFYHQYTFFISNPDTAVNRYGVDLTNRKDYIPEHQQFSPVTQGYTFNLYGALQENPNSQLRWKATYRVLDILDSANTAQQYEESVLGRIEYSFALLKGFIRSATLYEVGSGQEQRREYTYLRVPTGQGSYIWNDDGDGIQELDEFEPASDNDQIYADFLRIITPTNEYIRANTAQFNEILNIDPAALWKGQEGFKGFLAKFSNTAAVQINKKVLAEEGLDAVNPFNLDIAEENLVTVNSILRNTLYYNRTGATFGGELLWQDSRNKQFLTNGPESRRRLERGTRLRWNITREILTEVRYINGLSSSFSEALFKKNFFYIYNQVEPKITYQSGTKFRVSLQYTFSEKENLPEYGDQFAAIDQLTSEVRYNVLSKSTLNFKISYASILFLNGDPRSSLAYSMLEGLQPGRNYIWGVGYERNLSNNVQLSLNYDGRKSGESAVTHVGRAQVRAIF